MDEAFCKSTGGSFGRNIVCREDKSISRVNVHFNKKKRCPFHGGSFPE